MKFNDASMRKITRAIETAQKKSAKRALDRAIIGLRKDASMAVRNKYNIKAGDAKDAMVIRKPRLGPIDHMVATLNVYFKAIPLFKFGARQTKKGVRVKVMKAGQRKTIRSAFVGQVGSTLSAFTRLNKSGTAVSKRLPIRKLPGPPVIGAMKNEALQQGILQNAKARLKREYKSAFEFFMGKEKQKMGR